MPPPSTFPFFTLLLLALLPLTVQQDPSLCPTDSGLVLSGRLSFSTTTNSSLFAIPAEKTLTYNHSLASPFLRQPGVAVSLTTFSTPHTHYLMISVKPLPMVSPSTLQLLLRFFQSYSQWTILQINFLAEDRTDMEADYYEIDTRQLGTDVSSKAVQISLPISTAFIAPVAVYFLNGFELSSLLESSTSNIYTPFEIAITGASSNGSAIQLIASTSTSSQIFSLLISYLAFENSTSRYSAGMLLSTQTAQSLSAPVVLPSAPLAFIDGISGFILSNQHGVTSFSAILSNNAFLFTFQPRASYLNYQFFAVPNTNDPCFYCENNPLNYNGTCVGQCPTGSSSLNGSCVSCPVGEEWNGTHCVLLCTGGRIWSETTLSCECPNALIWNGNTCIVCPSGQIWDASLGHCNCPYPNEVWTGIACKNLTCGDNQVLNPFTLQCDCTVESNWDGSACILCQNNQSWNGSACLCVTNCTNCPVNSVWDSASRSCVCTNNSYFNGFGCIVCSGGMVFDSTSSVCVCPSSQAWNGTYCILPCINPLVYSNGQCVCPSGTTLTNGTCETTPACPTGQTYSNNICSPIACAVGYFWNGTSCVQYVQACPLNSYWNGITCITSSAECPQGSTWNGTYCVAVPACEIGTYLSAGQCIYFPQLCLPSYSWNGTGCLAVGLAVTCLNNQLFNGTACVAVVCSDGREWSSLLNQCICNRTAYWNGLGCLSCPSGQIWSSGGCSCPVGYFLIDNLCYGLQQVYCSFVSSATWNGSNCVCQPGFSAVGVNCICNGIIINSSCDLCYNKPHSIWSNGSCQCNTGFYDIFGECKSFDGGQNNATSCHVGTLLLNAVCVPCSDGCLSCTHQNVCVQCWPEFTYNWASYSCVESCGDGYRFSLSCDDGNNLNGDGCTSDCQIESGYTCSGGSPNSADSCTLSQPASMAISITGTSHLYGVINVNLKANYLPSNLTDIASACTTLCQQILTLNIVSGDSATIGMVTKYFPGTRSFAVQFSFGREPIGEFTIQVGINPSMAAAYFPMISSTGTFQFVISPAFLTMYQPEDTLA